MPTEMHPGTHAKAAAVHPLTAEANSLKEEIAKTDEKHREELAKLRQKATDLYAKAAGENLSPANLLTFSSVQTEVDTGLNYLDPDCSATKPAVPEEPEKSEAKRG